MDGVEINPHQTKLTPKHEWHQYLDPPPPTQSEEEKFYWEMAKSVVAIYHGIFRKHFCWNADRVKNINDTDTRACVVEHYLFFWDLWNSVWGQTRLAMIYRFVLLTLLVCVFVAFGYLDFFQCRL